MRDATHCWMWGARGIAVAHTTGARGRWGHQESHLRGPCARPPQPARGESSSVPLARGGSPLVRRQRQGRHKRPRWRCRWRCRTGLRSAARPPSRRPLRGTSRAKDHQPAPGSTSQRLASGSANCGPPSGDRVDGLAGDTPAVRWGRGPDARYVASQEERHVIWHGWEEESENRFYVQETKRTTIRRDSLPVTLD